LKTQVAALIDDQTRLKAECQARQAENSVLAVECDSLKAEVDRLTSDIQMEKENEDRLVREWQKANNEVYGLQRQVAALIDDQTRLKAEVERLTKAEDNMIEVTYIKGVAGVDGKGGQP
jgi:regulator of replication initiation timing